MKENYFLLATELSYHTSTFHQSSDHASSLWPHHGKMACITAPFQTIKHSCFHLTLKGYCRIWGRQTSRGFLTEGPSRWIKWAEMPRKHLTYIKVSPGHMHYRALSRLVKTSRDQQKAQILSLQQKIYLKNVLLIQRRARYFLIFFNICIFLLDHTLLCFVHYSQLVCTANI